jgi:hypothetical protein
MGAIFMGLVLLSFGVFYLFWPETAWKLQTALLVKGGEPTPLAFLWYRICGVVCCLAGIGALIAGIVVVFDL